MAAGFLESPFRDAPFCLGLACWDFAAAPDFFRDALQFLDFLFGCLFSNHVDQGLKDFCLIVLVFEVVFKVVIVFLHLDLSRKSLEIRFKFSSGVFFCVIFDQACSCAQNK